MNFYYIVLVFDSDKKEHLCSLMHTYWAEAEFYLRCYLARYPEHNAVLQCWSENKLESIYLYDRERRTLYKQ